MGLLNSGNTEKKEWIIQICIDASNNEYKDWPGYCEDLMTRSEMLVALEKCEKDWVGRKFRGHNMMLPET